jgi:hypothetical protein
VRNFRKESVEDFRPNKKTRRFFSDSVDWMFCLTLPSLFAIQTTAVFAAFFMAVNGSARALQDVSQELFLFFNGLYFFTAIYFVFYGMPIRYGRSPGMWLLGLRFEGVLTLGALLKWRWTARGKDAFAGVVLLTDDETFESYSEFASVLDAEITSRKEDERIEPYDTAA